MIKPETLRGWRTYINKFGTELGVEVELIESHLEAHAEIQRLTQAMEAVYAALDAADNKDWDTALQRIIDLKKLAK